MGGNNRAMSDQPAPTEQEQEEAPERQEEEQATPGPGHENPELPGDDPPAAPIHES
jgi:hypothetical protein